MKISTSALISIVVGLALVSPLEAATIPHQGQGLTLTGLLMEGLWH
jgi:hypothetical protein